ncbi:DUF2577 family protein [Wukongibacter sp. M2B1]|uniref:DUF2577 family protein n=1 Tax=Wukongibacter sp. M2B1 TaxID=3088895 RepID=UPI003D7A2A68
MDGISELARLFKDRENKLYLGPQTGRVISSFPNIKIKLGDKIVLDKKHLIISEQLIKKRGRFTLKAKETVDYPGKITLEKLIPGDGENGDTIQTLDYDIADIQINRIDQTEIEIKYDGLKVGDEVIMIPTTNEQKYYVIDKVVSL